MTKLLIYYHLFPFNFPYRKYNYLVMQLGISKSISKRKRRVHFYEKADKISCSIICSSSVSYRCLHDFPSRLQAGRKKSGTWVYYDNDGYKVSNEWKKSGNNWFYLNDDGEMATETLVEDGDYTYYVDENGVMVANRWVQVANDDDNSDDAPANYWYYFQASGKAYKAGDSTSFKTINGKKYAFDDEGKMLYGWVDGTSNRITDDEGWKESTTLYYCGTEDDGAQRVGWAQIHVINKDEDDEDQDYWFYFKANGKKLFAEDGIPLPTKQSTAENMALIAGVRWYLAGQRLLPEKFNCF